MTAGSRDEPGDTIEEGETVAPLAAFDLDGTITWADAFTTFLRQRTTRMDFWRRTLPLAPLFPAYLAGALDRRRLKERFATRHLAGVALEAVDAEAAAFWDGPGARLLRADALDELARLKAAGWRVAIVTACPEIVAAPLAARLGAALIGTRLEVENGRLTGRIEGQNCRGPEKVARIAAHFGADATIAAAYGDSAGDREMLAAAADPRLRPFNDGPRLPLLATIAMWF
ncbi:MAG: HAD-IB family hydrolase [Maricaulaceae bacterium]|jgi:phosphatidylglycerophosphatase C